MKRLCFFIIFFPLCLLSARGQDADLYRYRMKQLDIENSRPRLFIGLLSSINKNFSAGFDIGVLEGPEYRPVNINAGLGFEWENPFPFPSRGVDYVSCARFNLHLGVRYNYYRFKGNTMFLQADIIFSGNLGGGYHNAEGVNLTSLSSMEIVSKKPLWAPRVKLGMIRGKFEASVFFRYDLLPAYNQSNIFNNERMDYYAVRSQIDERWRVGLMLNYYLW